MSDILINGKAYNGVDTINVQKQGGGTAKFTEGERPSGTIEIKDNGNYDVTNYASANVSIEKGITPTGTIEITENGEHDVSSYATAVVMVVGENGESKELVIELPESFAECDDVFYFKVDSNTILFSAYSKLIRNKETGIYTYNIKDNTFTKKFDSVCCNQFYISDNLCFMSANRLTKNVGILIYNIETQEVSHPVNIDKSFNTFFDFDIGIIFACQGVSGQPLSFYDKETKEITVSSILGTYTTIVDAGNYIILTSSASYGKGVVVFDRRQKIFSKIYDVGYGWKVLASIDNLYLIGGGSSAVGVILFNSDDGSINLIRDTLASWNKAIAVGKNFLIMNNNAQPILLYESETQTTTEIYSDGKIYGNVDLKNPIVYDNKVIIPGYSADTGMLLYNNLTKEISKIYETGKNWIYTIKVGDKYLISSNDSSTSKGLLLLDTKTDTISMFDSTLSGIKFGVVVGNNAILSQTGSLGYVYFYNGDNGTIEKRFQGIGYFSIVEELGNGNYYIKQEGDRPYVLEYNPTDKTLKLVKYNLGVV